MLAKTSDCECSREYTVKRKNVRKRTQTHTYSNDLWLQDISLDLSRLKMGMYVCVEPCSVIIVLPLGENFEVIV